MPRTRPKTRTLSIFLIKPELSEPEQILDFSKNLTPHHISSRGTQVGTLYLAPTRSGLPAWARFFEPALDVERLGLLSASSSGVLLVPQASRIFALSFGQGRHLLQPGSYEENFGLKVTLNSVDPSKIRSIDRKSFDAIARHTREQASREVPILDFGLDVEQDLLRAVIGKPIEESLGKRLAGMDSLATTIPINLEDIPAQMELYLAKSQEITYKEDFPWVDHIAEVKSPSLKIRLDTALLKRIIEGDFDRLWLAVPKPIEWTDVEGFHYSTDENREIHDDLHIRDFLRTVDPSHLTIEVLKRIRVHCKSSSLDQDLHTWSLYRCIYAEVELDDSTYLLTEGSWYRIDRDFANDINSYFDSFPRSAIELPPFADEDEEAYNKRVAEQDPEHFVCLDRDLVRYRGERGGIEFCDLFSADRTMVHVKIYGGSSVLSHLFSQGVVPAQLFLLEPKFRRMAAEKFSPLFRLADPEETPSARDYEVVYAIISRSPKPLTIPFFSRVNLRLAAQRLRSLGYRVSIKKIPFA